MKASALPVLAAILLAAQACKTPVPLYCESHEDCPSERPFCDVNGDYEASDYVGRTCIADPRPDAGAEDGDAGSDDADVAPRVVKVALGSRNTCIVSNLGEVRCWGKKELLGYPATEDLGDDELPSAGEPVPLPMAARDVALGGFFACALLVDGSVRCWGDNSWGLLGLGHTGEVDGFPAVSLNGPARQIGVSAEHACALLEDGKMQCWGSNYDGEGGRPEAERLTGDDETPFGSWVELPGTPTDMSIGAFLTCARLVGDLVTCWGRNSSGQLGLGSIMNIGDDETPESAGTINAGGAVSQISAGNFHVCAVVQGKVRCWGNNEHGQLGDGSTSNRADEPGEMPPPPVTGALQVTTVRAGAYHTCALTESGAVHCWGRGELGEHGMQTTENLPVPNVNRALDLGVPATDLAATSRHSCVITEARGLRCWGDNRYGQLGYGSTSPIGDDEAPGAGGDIEVFPAP